MKDNSLLTGLSNEEKSLEILFIAVCGFVF